MSTPAALCAWTLSTEGRPVPEKAGSFEREQHTLNHPGGPAVTALREGPPLTHAPTSTWSLLPGGVLGAMATLAPVTV